MNTGNPPRVGAAAIAAAATLVFTACTPSGPTYLAMGGDEGTLCIPAANNEEIALGETVKAESDVTVSSVELLDLAGLKTVESASVITLSDGATAIGAQPLRVLRDEVGGPWDERIPAESARLEAGQHYSVVVVVKLEGQTGTAQRMRVTYQTPEGLESTAEGTTAYELAPSCN